MFLHHEHFLYIKSLSVWGLTAFTTTRRLQAVETFTHVKLSPGLIWDFPPGENVSSLRSHATYILLPIDAMWKFPLFNFIVLCHGIWYFSIRINRKIYTMTLFLSMILYFAFQENTKYSNSENNNILYRNLFGINRFKYK